MGTILTVAAKGQVTLRKEVLEHLGAGPGDKLLVEMMPCGRIELRAAPSGSIADFIGSLARLGTQPLTIDEMNAIAADGWAGKR